MPMFLMGQHTHWQMVGMPMTTEMWIGMAMIPIGLVFAMYGLTPRLDQLRQRARAPVPRTTISTSPTACR